MSPRAAGSLVFTLLLAAAESAEPPMPVISRDGLEGKVLCGYQGWFACEGDGAGLGWVHWNRSRDKPPGPSDVTVDLWPDVSELGPDERFATGFTGADGKPAEVFSSFLEPTVARHFEWMRDYGIDGVFVQRFASELNHPGLARHRNTVLSHCRDAAGRTGRVYAVMYDLSGLGRGEVERVAEDWRALEETLDPANDAQYLRVSGRPLVAVWGVGFNDGRRYSLDECRQLVAALRDAGMSVMLGVPTGWRQLHRDALDDSLLHEIIAMADVVSPWTIGRYRTPDEAAAHGRNVLEPDTSWCRSRGLHYLPVVFPGFSWHNLRRGDAPLDDIPRLGGRFLWSQFLAAREAGLDAAYVAMFDEVDEGTAIFKCSPSPPRTPPDAGYAKFLPLDDVASDHYLRLTGLGGKLLRREIPAAADAWRAP